MAISQVAGIPSLLYLQIQFWEANNGFLQVSRNPIIHFKAMMIPPCRIRLFLLLEKQIRVSVAFWSCPS
jgi:hypothetical protein